MKFNIFKYVFDYIKFNYVQVYLTLNINIQNTMFNINTAFCCK